MQDAVNLTDTQVQDLLYLRGLFRGKSSQILEDRKKLLSMLSSVSAGNGHVSDKMTGMTALSEQLRENASDEYRVSMQLTSVMFRGVSCSDCSLACADHSVTSKSSISRHCSGLE